MSERIVIVGAGRITADSHLPAALAAPGVEIGALVDADPERARSLARAAGVDTRVASSLSDVLDGADAVIVATPNDSHAALAITCLEAGVHVLIEKPLATTVADAEAVARAAEASGCVAAVGFCTRFQDSVQLMGELLEQEFFGAVRRFAYQLGVVGGWASASGFHLDRAAAGGGVLVTTGTHFLDRMLYWFGPPASCELLDDSLGGPEANAVARFAWDGGRALVGSARFSKTVTLPAGFVMETERGTVVLREGERETIRFWPAETPGVECALRPSEPGPAAGLFERQLADFLDACRQGRAPAVSTADGVAGVRLVDELYAKRGPLPAYDVGGAEA